ncbi:MAG: helix-turn-helix transcriptional regulator [Acidimicrobiia bacterium]
MTALDPDLAAIGSLQEPVRRALYAYVAGSRAEVSRDQAAEAVGIRRSLAAFHLDKLVEAGLLETTFRRLSGRSGPGAGRPSKLYRRSDSEHSVSVPPRQYDLAAKLLAEAVDEAREGPARRTVDDVAHRFGRQLGEATRARVGPRASRPRRLAALVEELEARGYEPRLGPDGVRLRNCPFHALAESHRALVCGMNLALLEGVVDGMADATLAARQEPRPGECCVALALTRRKG